MTPEQSEIVNTVVSSAFCTLTTVDQHDNEVVAPYIVLGCRGKTFGEIANDFVNMELHKMLRSGKGDPLYGRVVNIRVEGTAGERATVRVSIIVDITTEVISANHRHILDD